MTARGCHSRSAMNTGISSISTPNRSTLAHLSPVKPALENPTPENPEKFQSTDTPEGTVLPSSKRNTLATAFLTLTCRFPNIRKQLWQLWYNRLARGDADSDFRFMNYGYHDPSLAVQLRPGDEGNRLPILLYEQLIHGIDLNGKHLLEVGSGRGGGLAYIADYKQATSLTGVDLAKQAIKRCVAEYADKPISFLHGSADNLPCADNSMDVVINVESSHCYPDIDKFLREVRRVLKPDGVFCLCDLRTHEQIAQLEEAFRLNGFATILKHDITESVLSALDILSGERVNISNKAPGMLRGMFSDFSGAKSTPVYEMIKHDKLVYMSYRLKTAAG